MELSPLTPELRDAWDEFCMSSPNAWFWHTTKWLDFTLAYRPDLKPKSYSFLCKEGDRIMAIVPLFLEQPTHEGKEWRAFTFGGGPLPAPALAPDITGARRAKMQAFLAETIEGLAAELGAAYAQFRFDALRPGAATAPPEANFFLRHGFTDASSDTQVIDLRPAEENLWDNVRRDHRRSIEKARDQLDIRIHSADDMSDGTFESYQAMHARASGRVTRPPETFRIMRDCIRAGRGFLAEARFRDGTSAGFELFLSLKNAVYSGSACNEPGHERLPIRHLIEWESILWMKSRGFERYEIGGAQASPQPHSVFDKKNLDISLFKNGFGGAPTPVPAAERFYSREYWEQERRRREAIFVAAYRWGADSAAQASSLLSLFDKAQHPPAPDQDLVIPDSLREFAARAIQENPKALESHLNGGTKAVSFLVGAAMSFAGSGTDPRLLRRAIEESLARIIARGADQC